MKELEHEEYIEVLLPPPPKIRNWIDRHHYAWRFRLMVCWEIFTKSV
jgi:hypothetical protein